MRKANTVLFNLKKKNILGKINPTNVINHVIEGLDSKNHQGRYQGQKPEGQGGSDPT